MYAQYTPSIKDSVNNTFKLSICVS